MRFGLLVVLGLIFAAGLGLGAHFIARDTVALPVSSLEAGRGLAPTQTRAAAKRPAVKHPAVKKTRKKTRTTQPTLTRPTTTTPFSARPATTAVPEAEHHGRRGSDESNEPDGDSNQSGSRGEDESDD